MTGWPAHIGTALVYAAIAAVAVTFVAMEVIPALRRLGPYAEPTGPAQAGSAPVPVDDELEQTRSIHLPPQFVGEKTEPLVVDFGTTYISRGDKNPTKV